jgi:hypothetical protein
MRTTALWAGGMTVAAGAHAVGDIATRYAGLLPTDSTRTNMSGTFGGKSLALRAIVLPAAGSRGER